jgi:hypothetical protein
LLGVMNQRFLALLVLFVSFAACGPTVAKCTTVTCTGCCDQKTDTCLAGSEDAACGAGGTLCVACPAADACNSNRVCARKPAETTGPRCTASNCDGCCSDTGDCFKGVSSEACGAGGSSCAVCAVGQTCQKLNPTAEFGGACRT